LIELTVALVLLYLCNRNTITKSLNNYNQEGRMKSMIDEKIDIIHEIPEGAIIYTKNNNNINLSSTGVSL